MNEPSVPTTIASLALELQRSLDHLEATRGLPRWVHNDLTFGQLRLLFLIANSGPQSISQVAERFRITLASASGFVDRVEKQGLVRRQHREDDRRVVECVLSERGVQLLSEITGLQLESLTALLSVLHPDELEQMRHLLKVMADRLESGSG